jgi:hypothetical protein
MKTPANIAKADTGDAAAPKSRPILLSLLCMVSFVFFFMFSMLFLAGMLKAEWITGVTNQYLLADHTTRSHTMLVFGAGFLLHAAAFTGTVFIWNLRKSGYYILGISCLTVASYQLFNPLTVIASTAIYIVLILSFGIFFKRLN